MLLCIFAYVTSTMWAGYTCNSTTLCPPISSFVTVHEKIDHNAGIIHFYLAPGMLSMTLSALTVQVWWLYVAGVLAEIQPKTLAYARGSHFEKTQLLNVGVVEFCIVQCLVSPELFYFLLW